MKFFKTLSVLLGVFLVLAGGVVLGFEFVKPFLMPYLPEGLSGDLETSVRPLQIIEQLVLGGVLLVLLNMLFSLNKWLFKGVNLFVNFPLALAGMAGAGYGGYLVYLSQMPQTPEYHALMGCLFILSLLWAMIAIKVNVLGRTLFKPKDWDARKKKVDAVVAEVKEELGLDDAEEEVKV